MSKIVGRVDILDTTDRDGRETIVDNYTQVIKRKRRSQIFLSGVNNTA